MRCLHAAVGPRICCQPAEGIVRLVCGNASVNGKAHTLAALLVMSTTHGARIEGCFDSTVTQDNGSS